MSETTPRDLAKVSRSKEREAEGKIFEGDSLYNYPRAPLKFTTIFNIPRKHNDMLYRKVSYRPQIGESSICKFCKLDWRMSFRVDDSGNCCYTGGYPEFMMNGSTTFFHDVCLFAWLLEDHQPLKIDCGAIIDLRKYVKQQGWNAPQLADSMQRVADRDRVHS